MTNRRHGAYVIVIPLAFPDGDARVEQSVGEGEEHLDILIQTVSVTARNELSEQTPVAGRRLGRRSVRPVFGDHLLAIAQVGADVEYFKRLAQIWPSERLVMIKGGRLFRPEL